MAPGAAGPQLLPLRAEVPRAHRGAHPRGVFGRLPVALWLIGLMLQVCIETRPSKMWLPVLCWNEQCMQVSEQPHARAACSGPSRCDAGRL